MKYQIVGMMYKYSDQEQAILEDENGKLVAIARIDCYAPSIENQYKVLMRFEINE